MNELCKTVMERCSVKNIRILWLLLSLLLLLYLPLQSLGLSQTRSLSIAPLTSSHGQQIFQEQIFPEFMSLLLKHDICALLDHCEVPPLSKTNSMAAQGERQLLFAIFPHLGQTEVRLQRDTLLRHYIDRLRELVIIFSRLNISAQSAVNHRFVHVESPDYFYTQVTIKTPPSCLADTISPDFAGRSILLSFTLTVACSKHGWKIIGLSKSSFSVIPPCDAAL